MDFNYAPLELEGHFYSMIYYYLSLLLRGIFLFLVVIVIIHIVIYGYCCLSLFSSLQFSIVSWCLGFLRCFHHMACIHSNLHYTPNIILHVGKYKIPLLMNPAWNITQLLLKNKNSKKNLVSFKKDIDLPIFILCKTR